MADRGFQANESHWGAVGPIEPEIACNQSSSSLPPSSGLKIVSYGLLCGPSLFSCLRYHTEGMHFAIHTGEPKLCASNKLWDSCTPIINPIDPDISSLPTVVFALAQCTLNGNIHIDSLPIVPPLPSLPNWFEPYAITNEDYVRASNLWWQSANKSGALAEAISKAHRASCDTHSALDYTVKYLSYITGPGQLRYPRVAWQDERTGASKNIAFKLAFRSTHNGMDDLLALAKGGSVDLDDESQLRPNPSAEIKSLNELQLANVLAHRTVRASEATQQAWRMGRRIYVNQAELSRVL